MKSIVSFFQRLQWKLTLSYAVVTAGTVIVLAALLIGIVIYIDSRVPEGIYSSFYWSKTAFQDNVPYLMDDHPTLQAWVTRVQKQGFRWTDFQSYTVKEALDY